MLDDIDDDDDDGDDDDDDDQPIWAVQGECRVGVQLAADLLDAGDRQLIKCFTKLFLNPQSAKTNTVHWQQIKPDEINQNKQKKQLLPLNVP